MEFDKRINKLSDAASEIIPNIQRGIEKESLRITKEGNLSQNSHPITLGSALTHPYFTTDYSEALLELVTPTFDSVEKLLEHLVLLHKVVYHHIEDELLWVNSLPCLLQDEKSIPIACFGNSNIGRMKHVYRRGLALRYGRKMQVIAGIHYNFSVPDQFWPVLDIPVPDADNSKKVSNAYMAAIRNFHRYCWLIFYLFGASPAACRSFFSDLSKCQLEHTGNHTLHGKYATSLRMSNYGYRNPIQSQITIDNNSIDGYVNTLCNTITTPFKQYANYGVKSNGEYLQLNSNLLQIENEYYTVIRPKRQTEPLERPTQALKRRGIEYLEVRCLDLNPFEPIGISTTQAKFMDLFLMLCLIQPSDFFFSQHPKIVAANKDSTVLNGRKPGLMLQRNGKAIKLKSWGLELLEQLEVIADVFDSVIGSNGYRQSVLEQKVKLLSPEQTPSAKITEQLLKDDIPFFSFSMLKSEQSKKALEEKRVEHECLAYFKKIADDSIQRQNEIEQADHIDFDEFLEKYFSR